MPQTLRYPSPAPGAAAGGRHRRPESLADTHSPRPAYDDGEWTDGGRVADRRIAVPIARTARHRRVTETTPDGRTLIRRVETTAGDRVPARRTADQLSRTRRHAAAHRAPAGRPPVTGSHRAPGTLPIESWLLMGKKRQQLLLASLVAAGLLLLAVPTEHRSSGVDAVNAAAQRAAGTHAPKNQKAGSGNDGGKATADRGGAAPAPAGSAPAAGPETAPPGRPEHGLKAGPAHSLRTTGTRAVALTFDDGPDPVTTPQILALLDQYHIKATFCLVGEQAAKHPEVVRQIVAAGHTLCNHTWDHSLTIGKDKPEQIREDLSRTKDAIEAAVPGVRVPFFRAPGGNFTDRLVSVASEYGMTSLYWEVDPRDWDHKDGETDAAHTARVVADVKKRVRPGSIVLSHDFNQPDTIAAYQKLLPWLAEHFTFGIPGEPVPDQATTPPASTPAEPPDKPAPTDPPAAAVEADKPAPAKVTE